MERLVQPAFQPAMPGLAGLPQRGQPRLLVVDDEPLMAEYFAAIAEDCGWNVDLASTAEEFEAKITADEPDMVALDLAMPGRDGVELLRFLASSNYLGNLIIVSACDVPIVETSAMLAREHGLALTGYLQKPILEEDFAALLEQAVTMIPESALDRCHQ